MITAILVAALAFGTFVLVTAAIAYGVPRILWRGAAVVGLACVLLVVLAARARTKAIRIGELLMEPSRSHEYERWDRFELLSLSWDVHFASRDVYADDPVVSVNIFGPVDVGSKYFVDRARELAVK